MRLIAVLLAALLTLPAAAQSFPPGSAMERLSKAPKLRIGVKFDQPLFGLRNLSGQPVGFDVEVAKLIAAKLGVPPARIEWIETSSANREPFIQQGKVDLVVATYAITDKRRQVINQAGPYIVGGQDLLVRKGNPLGIKGPDDLSGRRACVIGGSEGQAVLVGQYPKATVIPFDVISKCVEALKNGSVDAVVTTDLIEAGLASRDAANLQLVGNPFTREPWGVGLPRADADLCRFVNAVLEEAGRDGTYAKLYDASLKAQMGRTGTLPQLDPCP